MTNEESRKLPNGIYLLRWIDDLLVGDYAYTLAAVGRDAAGNVWYAPTNWIAGLPCFDWSRVAEAFFVTDIDHVLNRRNPSRLSKPPHSVCELYEESQP